MGWTCEDSSSRRRFHPGLVYRGLEDYAAGIKMHSQDKSHRQLPVLQWTNQENPHWVKAWRHE